MRGRPKGRKDKTPRVRRTKAQMAVVAPVVSETPEVGHTGPTV